MFNEHENYEEELEVNTSNLDEESKKLRKNFIKILIELVISSLVYLISSACSKIGIMTSGFEVQNMIILKYAHYIMIVAYILSILGIILLILQLLKIKLPGCLSYARDLALVSKFTEADTADSVLTEVGVGSTTDLASVISASGELRLLLLLKYH